MTEEEAGNVVAYLNAGFPRDALEPETAAIWIREVEALARYDAAKETAQKCVRETDRFPTVKEFRTTYRQTVERINAGRELEVGPESHLTPEEAVLVGRLRAFGKDTNAAQ